MSKEVKSPPSNLYGMLDNELARMHALLQTFMTLPERDSYHSSYGGLSHGKSFTSPANSIPQIYKRIIDMQDLMLKALVAHDSLIQDKVAELALMGTEEKKDETIPTR